MRAKGVSGPVGGVGNSAPGAGISREGMNQLSFKKPRNPQETQQIPQTGSKMTGGPGIANKQISARIEPFGGESQQLSGRPITKPDYSQSPQKAAPKKAPDRMAQSEAKPQKVVELKLPGSQTKNPSSENVNLDLPADLTASEDAESSKPSRSSQDQANHSCGSSLLKALKKEKKSLAYLLKVRSEIQKELDQRVSACRSLKKRVEELADEQQKLLPRLDRLEVSHQSDLESLQ